MVVEVLETSGVVSKGQVGVSSGIVVVLDEGVLVDSWVAADVSVGKVEETSSLVVV